ncbi:hypothetical protein PSHT_06331 [Puccinia striiformis]|uniref:Uncharacterized protein n=1 Tax=Puccinia striiformis TaxID=27350 RepID=A0A2S4W6S0_9BASI|nr:hypothetical protein PSHT_06331 [Puccinia striiformis]
MALELIQAIGIASQRPGSKYSNWFEYSNQKTAAAFFESNRIEFEYSNRFDSKCHALQSMYDAQELIPAATLMIAKLREYFNAAVKKPVYVFSTMLNPCMKADVLTNSVLDILNMDKATVIQTFQDTAQGFVGSHYKETKPSPKKVDKHHPSISSALFKKKKNQDYFSSGGGCGIPVRMTIDIAKTKTKLRKEHD